MTQRCRPGAGRQDRDARRRRTGRAGPRRSRSRADGSSRLGRPATSRRLPARGHARLDSGRRRGRDPRADRRPPAPGRRGARAVAGGAGGLPVRSRSSIGRVRRRGAARATDGWIEGGGWDPDALGRWPTADDLERAAPGRRVALWAHDHHALLASHAALAEADVGERAADPPGGVIRRDADGSPDRRPPRVREPASSPRSCRRRPCRRWPRPLRPLGRELLALGVVAVHDPGSLATRDGLGGPLEAYRDLAAAGELGLRVHASIRAEQLEAAGEAGLRSGRPLGPDPLGRLRLGWLKTFADGSLGSRTAALLRTDGARRRASRRRPTTGSACGSPTPDAAARAQAARAAALGHRDPDPRHRRRRGPGRARRAGADGRGDRPDAAGSSTRSSSRTTTSPRFAALGIAASVQPVHLRSDVDKARRAVGRDRAERRRVPARRARPRAAPSIAFGTDAPVEPIDPWPGIACAVTRVGAVVAARDAAARARPGDLAVAGDPGRVRRPGDHRRRARPRAPRRRPPGGRRRAARRRRSRSRSRSAERCGTRGRGWCWSTARSSPAADRRRSRPRASSFARASANSPLRIRDVRRERVDRLGQDVDLSRAP